MTLQISAKNLGALAMSDFCPRCFWIELQLKRIPFEMPFPAIFHYIDSHVKNVVHEIFARDKQLPPWYPEIGDVADIADIPHHTKYRVEDAETNVILTGMPDEVLKMKDGSYHIIDYKTSKKTSAQNELFPMYRVQLNGYAYIGQRTVYPEISGLSLIYTEPLTDFGEDSRPVSITEPRLLLDFKLTKVDVELSPEPLIPELMRRAAEIEEMDEPPRSLEGCIDCKALEELLEVARRAY